MEQIAHKINVFALSVSSKTDNEHEIIVHCIVICIVGLYGGHIIQQTRKTYDDSSLEKAIEAVMQGKMNQSQAGRMFGVPQPAISYQIRKRMKYLEETNLR